MASDAEVAAARQQLQSFLSGPAERMAIGLPVTAPLPERIAWIYRVVFPGWSRLRFYGRFLVARVAGLVDYSPVKVWLYRAIGCRIGVGVFISPNVKLDPHFPDLITLEDHCILGWGAALFTHEYDGRVYRVGRVVIGRGAVVGAGSVIRCGVRVGQEALVVPAKALARDLPDGFRP